MDEVQEPSNPKYRNLNPSGQIHSIYLELKCGNMVKDALFSLSLSHHYGVLYFKFMESYFFYCAGYLCVIKSDISKYMLQS